MRFNHLTPKLVKRRASNTASRSRHMRLQSLEDRRVLASFSPIPTAADGAVGSLREAIIAANSNGENDVITLAAGTYTLTQTASSEGLSNTRLSSGSSNSANETGNDLDLTEPNQTITIRGAGMDQTILNGNNIDRVLHVHPNVTLLLEDVTITGGNNDYDGGGFLNDGGTSTLRRVRLTGNRAAGEEIDTIQSQNGGGGGIANYFNSQQNRRGLLVIEDSEIINNTATDSRGRGGGLYAKGGATFLRNSLVANNTAEGAGNTTEPSGGGGIAVHGELTITDSIIEGNEAGAGAGILMNGGSPLDLEIFGSVIRNNEVQSSGNPVGGGIYIVGGTIGITDSLVHNNDGRNLGGGISIDGGGVILTNTTLSNNEAGAGGAIYNGGGGIVATNATISGNTANDTGGIFMESGSLHMTFSTVVNNNSTSKADRGALLNRGASNLIIDHSIIANNRSNSSPSAWEGSVQSGGYLIYNNLTSLSTFRSNGNATGNINLDSTGGSLNLGPLADNDGVPTTHALLAGSVAIDHGNNDGGFGTTFNDPPSTDARGKRRPQGASIDVGAFEFEVPNSPPSADAGGPYTASPSSTITVNGTGSSDPDQGDTLTYAWDLDNDGQFDDATSQSPTFSLAGVGINSVGTHTIRLRVSDFAGATDIDTTTITVSEGVIAGRHIFYNNSFFDSNDEDASPTDDNAIADKVALQHGSMADRENYTSYTRGINGIMVDIAGSANASDITVADFSFRSGRNLTGFGADFATAPAPSSVTVREGAGVGDSARVTLIWPDGTFVNKWLEVTVKANARTGISSPDVFYFGNAVGDAMDQSGNSAVDAIDFSGTRQNTHNFTQRADVHDVYDFNRDSLVNPSDLIVVRDNITNLATQLPMLDLTDSSAPSGGEGEGALLSEGEGSSPFLSEANFKSTADCGTNGLQKTNSSDAGFDEPTDEIDQELLLLAAAASEFDSETNSTAADDVEDSLDLIAEDLSGALVE